MDTDEVKTNVDTYGSRMLRTMGFSTVQIHLIYVTLVVSLVAQQLSG
jgi:hypothetical protein